ncbi:hypothetical protein CYMTET_46767 [Cymbomonas tetramitiformis]|uniref:Uncharacterized protein n=1 Tax=Cymbomonas tetramitiformis TaxID=36881 RepID=A0AAE0BXF9_9CHLO|nr:hypothetical protein CYMTET_46767 [Cymbomonas tetramitiformis]
MDDVEKIAWPAPDGDSESLLATKEWVKQGQWLQDSSTVGTGPKGRIRKMIFDHDPFKAYVRDANSGLDNVSLIFAVIFYICFVLYISWAIVAYVDRPYLESYSSPPMSEAEQVHINIQLSCNSGWGCYWWNRSATSSATWANVTGDSVEWVHVKQHYSDVSSNQCKGIVDEDTVVRNKFANTTVEGALCFSANTADGIEIYAPFSKEAQYNGDWALNVLIFANEEKGSSTMRVELVLEPSQRKTVTLGLISDDRAGRDKTHKLFISDLFYNGKNPDNRASIHIALSQSYTKYEEKRTGSLSSLVGEIGGASGFLIGILSVLRGLISLAVDRRLDCGCIA